jgi:hypothetical protein
MLNTVDSPLSLKLASLGIECSVAVRYSSTAVRHSGMLTKHCYGTSQCIMP